MALAVGAWLLQIELGVFGYSADRARLEETAAIRAWLDMANNGAKLVLVVFAIAVFSERYRRSPAIWAAFSVLILWEVAVGILSGFKSQVVAPAIAAALGYYVVRRRAPLRWIAAAGVLLFMAYAIVQPFRDLRYSSREFDGRSLRSIAGTVVVAATSEDGGEEEQTFFDALVGRQDLMTPTAVALAFENERGLPPGSPDFLDDLLMAPLNAYVPRFVWPTKRPAQVGLWFNIEVLGAPATSYTSVAMGPVAYFNFAGGLVAVFIGFFLLGVLQRSALESLASNGAGGILIFLALLPSLVILSDDVSGLIAGILRMLPFLLLAQLLLLRRTSALQSIGGRQLLENPAGPDT
jgi:hypothetical protein